MTVYVDNARIRYGRMRMCHMVADDIDELHAMADAIGVRRKWFQAHGYRSHYDVCLAMRARALQLGAVPVTRTELGRWLIVKRRLYGRAL